MIHMEYSNQARVLGPGEYAVLREKYDDFPQVENVTDWDDRLPIVWVKYRGMHPEYVDRFVEVVGKRRRKLKIRYAPVLCEHHGWNCDREVHEWVFYGGVVEHIQRVLSFYLVFYKYTECGARLHRGRITERWLVYREFVNVETGEVFHERVV